LLRLINRHGQILVAAGYRHHHARIQVRAILPNTYRYPPEALFLDGLRASFGLIIAFGPLIFLDVGRPLAVVLGGVGLVFLWFGFRVLAQCVVSITLSKDGLMCRGMGRSFLAWEDLTGLSLAYYAPMRRRQAGWYQLTLSGASRSIRLESTLDGFDEVLRLARLAADRAELVLDPSTRDNLAARAKQDRIS